MSFTAFDTKSPRDVVKEPQEVAEGVVTTASNYANKGGTNPNFTSCGPNAILKRGRNLVFKDRRNAGNVDRTGRQKISENNIASLSVLITDNNVNLVKWFINVPNGASTNDVSKTFLKSYNVVGTENFEVFSGCLPTRGKIMLDPEGHYVLEGEMICKAIDIATSHGLTGTPVFATLDAGVPWIGTDAGANSMDVNSVKYADFGLTLESVFELQILRPSENAQILHARISKRICSGSFALFKSSIALDEDAEAGTARAASKVLKASTLTATLAGMIWDSDDGDADDPDTSAASIKDATFTCDTITLA